MSKTWTFTTFENGRPVATYRDISQEEALVALARIVHGEGDIDRELTAAARRPETRELQLAA